MEKVWLIGMEGLILWIVFNVLFFMMNLFVFVLYFKIVEVFVFL